MSVIGTAALAVTLVGAMATYGGLRRRNRRLAGRLRLCADIVERLTDAVLVLHLDGRSSIVIGANPAAGELLGRPVESILGRALTAIAPELVPLIDLSAATDCSERADHGIVHVRQGSSEDLVLECTLLDLPGRSVAIIASDATASHQRRSVMEHRATHDPLTGLPNRALLQDRLVSALALGRRSGTRIALLMMDLDRFKDVNDTLGHETGDELLKVLAARLRSVLRESDTVARIGGDEFAIVLSTGTSIEGAADLARRLASAVGKPIEIDKTTVETEISIGIAIADEIGIEPAVLMKRADIAMYDAKRSGDTFRFYTSERDTTAKRLTILRDLPRAISEQHLEVHYQPKLEVATGHVVGVEALARWHHPRLGAVGPEEFVRAAELSGGIHELTRLVLERTVRDGSELTAAGRPLHVAVNLSVRNLYDDDMTRWLGHLLSRDGFDPSRLMLEVSESDAMADTLRAAEMLGALSALGVGTSIDDFGTGYSSMARLQELPVAEVKIDRSFVSRMGSSANDAIIVRSIIDLARNLGLDVVAEGVEDLKVLTTLRQLGCRFAQGFLIAPPMAVQDLRRWLATHGHDVEANAPSRHVRPDGGIEG